MRIDLPRMLLALREDSVEQGLVSSPVQMAERVSARMLTKPRWMQLFFRMGRFGQLMIKLFNLKIGGFENYPLVAKQSFRDRWAQMEAEDDSQK